MVDVIPNIGLYTDWSVIEERLNLVIPYAAWAQVDFCDNTWIPATTFLDFAKFKDISEKISLEAHLMVASPEKYLKAVVDAGFKRIVVHVEAHDPRLFFEQAEYEHVEVGIAIDGTTEFEQVEPFLEQADFVHVMTVEAGVSGGTFLPEAVEKIRSIHSYLPDLPIEVDGGITPQTARAVIDAGATRVVSSNFIFQDPAMVSHAIEALKNA